MKCDSKLYAGIDEVGVSSIAGPMVACVVLSYQKIMVLMNYLWIVNYLNPALYQELRLLLGVKRCFVKYSLKVLLK